MNESQQNNISEKDIEITYEKPQIEVVQAIGNNLDFSYKCFSVDRMCGHGDTGGCS